MKTEILEMTVSDYGTFWLAPGATLALVDRRARAHREKQRIAQS